MSMETISLSELLAAVESARVGGEGFTVSEFCAEHGINEKRARSVIKQAIAQGMVRVSRKVITDMSGRRLAVPSYVLTKRKRGAR
jgi:hypothetical protein